MKPSVEAPLRVAYQGEAGAFSEEAAHACFGAGNVAGLPQRDFAAVARVVDDGEAAAGMLPVENSIAGGVAPAYDVLAATDLVIVGEIVRPIRLCLLTLAGADRARLRRVLSHPVALAQCQQFLATMPHVEAIAVHDTAGAARLVAERGDITTAAVAGAGAAAHYGLEVTARDVEDRPDNQTRFFVLARPDAPALQFIARAGAQRTSLLLETAHRAGALVHALQPFAEHGISLSRIESRPAAEPWHYRFFLELDADTAAPATRAAIADATRQAHSLRVLGSFARLHAG